MRCKNCGKKISADSTFYSHCGSKIDVEIQNDLDGR